MPSGRLIDYLGVGAVADRPVAPDLHPGTLGVWFDPATGTASGWDGSAWTDFAGGGGGSGTVTSVGTGTGLTGGPITGSGTVALSSGSIASLALADSALQDAPSDGSTYGRKDGAWEAVSGGGGSGTVTSVAYSFDSSVSDVLSVSGSPVTTSGTLTASAVDAAADKIVFWDDSASKWQYLALGTNLSITGTTLNASGSGGSPAGSDKQIQYNNSGAFGAEAGFEYDASTNTLTVSNITTAGLLNTAASATGGAGFRLPHGAAPTSPTNGDVWTTSAGGMYVRINGTTVGPLAAAGGGGLTYFTESQNTSAPNATVYASVLKATGTATNIDAVISPKGTGAVLAQLPDNTTTGGNKRGANATDLQTSRGANTQVASGSGAITLGVSNTASASNSTAIGVSNTASGANSFAGGNNNTANSSGAVAMGDGNTAGGGGVALGLSNSANQGTAIGNNCNADADRSIAMGDYANTRGVIGAFAQCSRNLGAQVQGMGYVLSCDTTNATTTRLTTNAGAAASTNQVCLISSMSVVLRGVATARQDTTGDSASWEFLVHIKRGAAASTTAIVGTATVTPIASDSGASTWVLALSADTTNGALAVDFTGEASKTIRTGARVISCVHVQG